MDIYKKSAPGFSAVLVIIVLLVVGLVAGSGWYVLRGHKASSQTQASTTETDAKAFDAKAKADLRAKDFKTEGIVTFKHYSFIGDEKKNEIRAKIVDPMIFDYANLKKLPLKKVVVDINDARMSYDDAHFILNYNSGESLDSGFLFGLGGRINYYQPALCDDNGKCSPYPDSFKEKFPANYQVYLSCDTAKNDKDKQQELGCNL